MTEGFLERLASKRQATSVPNPGHDTEDSADYSNFAAFTISSPLSQLMARKVAFCPVYRILEGFLSGAQAS